MNNNQLVGLVMPKILYPNGDVQYLCKLLPTPIDLIIRRFIPIKSFQRRMNNKYELRFTNYNSEMEVPSLSGCFMFIRCEILGQSGIFDERYFMYAEDFDLCRRIGMLSKTIFYPNAQVSGRLAAWLFPLMACLCIGSGLACYRLGASTFLALAGVALAAICLYTRTLTISLWKSGTIALSVCAVFACVNSLSRAVSAAIIRNLQLPPDGPWLCLGACVFYNAVCWVIVLAAYYPATHTVRVMVEDDNFAQTWYVFWVLPLAFILLNLFMIPRYQSTLQTGRVLQGYIVLSSALLVFMFCFNAVFLLMATSLNRNAKLQQENQFLSMQQQRYENLRTAIEEARQARHDMRHQLNQISALAEAGDLENLKSYLAKTVSRIPNLDMCFCENRAADSVVGYYCAMAKRDEIPFRARLDLPETLPVDEIDMCLVLSNLLENALEASLRTAPDRRQIEITACVHADRILLIEVENAFDGEVNEKNGVFRSSKRRENGIGIQSVTRIAEKTGGTSTFTHQNGTFSAKVMLCG